MHMSGDYNIGVAADYSIRIYTLKIVTRFLVNNNPAFHEGEKGTLSTQREIIS